MAIWYHLENFRLSTIKALLLPDINSHNSLFSFSFLTLNKSCFFISSCTGSSPFLWWSWLDIPVWSHIFWSRVIRIAHNIPREVSWVPEDEYQYSPFGSTSLDTHLIFPWPCHTDGSILSLCRNSMQSMQPVPLPLWLFPAVSLWKRCFVSQVPSPRVCFIDFLLLWSPRLSSSFLYNIK